MPLFSPEQLVNCLEAHQKSNLTNLESYLIFKESKKCLKGCAKKGKLSSELRCRVSSVLVKKGFSTARNDARFRGLDVSSTGILFYSPKLWQILFHPSDYPQESAIVSSLANETFSDLVFLYKLPPANLENLAEVIQVVSVLNLPELEEQFKVHLAKEIESAASLNIKTAYLLSTILPPDRAKIISKHLVWFAQDGFTWTDIAAEFQLFTSMAKGAFGQEQQNLTAEAFYRFFLFLQCEARVNLNLGPLRLHVFDLLLNQLKSGALDAKYSRELIEQAGQSYDLKERLKKDTVDIHLKGINTVTVSLWPLFAKSNFVRTMCKSGMMMASEILLEANRASAFSLFYCMWIKGEELDLNALSVDQLICLLECAAVFDPIGFEDMKTKIAQGIIERCDNSPESILSLAELTEIVPCQVLEEHVISQLNSGSFFRIDKVKRGYFATITMRSLPSFAALRSGVRILEIFKIRCVHIEMNLGWHTKHTALMLLSEIYCATQLGLEKDKEVLEKQLSKLYNLEKDCRNDDQLKAWSPLDVVFLLNSLSEPVYADILRVLTHWNFDTAFWGYVAGFVKGENMGSLKEEAVFVETPDSSRLLQVSARSLPRLYFALQREAPEEELPEMFSALSLVTSQRIKETNVNFKLLKKAVEDCQSFFPERSEFIKNIRVEIEYSASSHVLIPLHLLLRMQIGRQLCAEGKIGNEFPLASIQWAIDFLEKAVSGGQVTITSATTFPAAHFQALQMLQQGVFEVDQEPMKRCAEKLPVGLFPEDTLLATAAWANSIWHKPLFNSCSRAYLGNETLQFENDTSRALCLSSFEAKTLQILKAIGADRIALKIDLETDATVGASSWKQVVEACPGLQHLTLYFRGKIPFLEEFLLSGFKKLNYLAINPRDTASIESLRALRIPNQSNITTLIFVQLDQLKLASSNAYEFFRNLPSKGVSLSVNFLSVISRTEQKGFFSRMWSYVESDPLNTLFSSLKHCQQLAVNNIRGDCLPYIIRHNCTDLILDVTDVTGDTERRIESSNLEELRIQYDDQRPALSQLQALFNAGKNLKKCQIEINFFGRSEARNGMQNYLEELIEHFKKSVTIELSGLYKNELDQMVKWNKEDPEKKEGVRLSLKINFF